MGSGAASIRDDAVRPDAVAILRALPGAYLVLNVDDDLTVAYATDGYVAATQMPRERLVGRPFAAVYGSEDGLNLHDSLRRVLATGRAAQLPATPLTFERAGVANPPGRQRYWSISHSLVSGEGESRAYLLHELIDQTEHREREDELREALSLVSFAGDVARIGGWSVDLRAGVVTWSDVVCDIHEVPHGFSTDVASEIDFYAKESRPIITERFQACVEHGEPFDEELVLSTATGRRVPVRAIGEAVYDDDGQVVLVHGAFQDQTDLRQIEAALLASHRRFRQFAEALQVIVWTALADGSVDYVNPAFWKYTGLAPDDVDLRTGEWISTVHPDDRDRVFAEWQSIMTVGGEVGPPPHRHHARRAAPRGHHHTDARAWRRGHPRHQRSRAAAQRERARDREVAVARGAFRESSGLARRAPASQTRPTWCASRSVHPQGQRSTNPKAAPTTPRAPHGGHFC